jgi:hypothetical protein
MPIDFDIMLVATYDCTDMTVPEIEEADNEIVCIMMLAGFRALDKDMRNNEIRCLTFEKDVRFGKDLGDLTVKPQYLS